MKRLVAIIVVCLLWPLAAHARDVVDSRLPVLHDLREEVAVMESRNIPMLIIITTTECEYCEYVKSQHLVPIHNNPEYNNRILIRELVTNNYSYFRDLEGNIINSDQFALRYASDLSPTLIFIDSQGQSLVKPLVGVVNPHFYRRELDRRIDLALQRLRG